MGRQSDEVITLAAAQDNPADIYGPLRHHRPCRPLSKYYSYEMKAEARSMNANISASVSCHADILPVLRLAG